MHLVQPSRDLFMAGRVVFWVSFFLISYTYVGYGLLLKIELRLLGGRPVAETLPAQPTVSILMAAHNEEKNLQRKLDNLAQMDYPWELIQTIVVSDGSSDRTMEILTRNTGVQGIALLKPNGKAFALNQAAAMATGEILVFFDIRQTVDRDAIRHLLSPFADAAVGVVSGELVLEASDGTVSAEALGIYWRIEKLVRKLESQTGSVIGATGAIYAMRRSLYVAMPRNTLLDDVFLPMHAARAGFRVLFQPAAIARDQVFEEKGKEFGRKVRTLTGNYQLFQLSPWLLTPANPLLFRFLSHKVLRLVVPLLLVLILIASVLLPAWFYRVALVLQLIFYGLAVCGALWPRTRRMKPVAIANTFVMLNLAAAKAFLNFVTGHIAWA